MISLFGLAINCHFYIILRDGVFLLPSIFPDVISRRDATDAAKRSGAISKIAEILNTEGLGSRIPQQEWQQDENPEMEFSYSVAVSCSKNVASHFLTKIVREKTLPLTPNFPIAFASISKKFFARYLQNTPLRLGLVKEGEIHETEKRQSP